MLERNRCFCSECEYWSRQDKNTGDCKRFPPVLTGTIGQKDDERPRFEWPRTIEADWCGEGQKASDEELKNRRQYTPS
jgi:hypothetical protein